MVLTTKRKEKKKWKSPIIGAGKETVFSSSGREKRGFEKKEKGKEKEGASNGGGGCEIRC